MRGQPLRRPATPTGPARSCPGRGVPRQRRGPHLPLLLGPDQHEQRPHARPRPYAFVLQYRGGRPRLHRLPHRRGGPLHHARRGAPTRAHATAPLLDPDPRVPRARAAPLPPGPWRQRPGPDGPAAISGARSTGRRTSGSPPCSGTTTPACGSTSGGSRTPTCRAAGSTTSRTRAALPTPSVPTLTPTRAAGAATPIASGDSPPRTGRVT